MRKVLSLLMVALLSTAFLFAGGSNESSDGPVVINHWYWVPNADVARYTEMIDEFNRTHTDVQVNWENVPQDDVRTRFITAFQIGEGPDTFGMGGNWIPEFQAMGMLEPLNDYIDNWDQKDEIIDTLWSQCTIGDTIYGMPWKLLVTYMYYRADWFEEMGIEPPETISEFIDAACKLTGTYVNENGETVDRYGFGLRGGSGNGEGYFIWCLTQGAEFFDEEGNVIFNSPETVAATQLYIDLYQKYHCVPPSCVGDGFAQIVGAFKSGRTAMFNHHIGTYVEISEALGDKVGVMLYPASDDGHRWSEGSVISHGISSISKHKDEAFEFVSWMSENWAVEHQSRYLGSIPVTKTVSAMPYFSENPFYAVSAQSAEYVGAFPMTVNWGGIVKDRAVTLLQQALMGDITAEEMVASIAEELEKGL